MRALYRPMLLFAGKMFFWSIVALGALVFVLSIVSRLDIAFFEANGMIKNPELRYAFYTQIFAIDPVFFGMLGAGLLTVAAVSMLFCKSQFDYFRRLSSAFSDFAEKNEVPSTSQMGQFSPHVGYFFDVTARRLKGDDEEKIQAVLDAALREWPKAPRVSWTDQAQFIIVSAFLGAFFSVLCMIFYWKVSDRVVDLSNMLVRFSNSSSPQFLSEQFTIMSTVVWAVLILTVVNFALTGYRFGMQIAEANYAILRDLRNYMEGNYNQRLFLRRGYPAHSFAVQINTSLDRVTEKLKERGVIREAA